MHQLDENETTVYAEQDPERRLFASIILQAVKDLSSGTTSRSQRLQAIGYFHSQNFEFDCTIVDIDPGKIKGMLFDNTSSFWKRLDKVSRALKQNYKADILELVKKHPELPVAQIAKRLELKDCHVRYFLIAQGLGSAEERVEWAKREKKNAR